MFFFSLRSEAMRSQGVFLLLLFSFFQKNGLQSTLLKYSLNIGAFSCEKGFLSFFLCISREKVIVSQCQYKLCSFHLPISVTHYLPTYISSNSDKINPTSRQVLAFIFKALLTVSQNSFRLKIVTFNEA